MSAVHLNKNEKIIYKSNSYEHWKWNSRASCDMATHLVRIPSKAGGFRDFSLAMLSSILQHCGNFIPSFQPDDRDCKTVKTVTQFSSGFLFSWRIGDVRPCGPFLNIFTAQDNIDSQSRWEGGERWRFLASRNFLEGSQIGILTKLD